MKKLIVLLTCFFFVLSTGISQEKDYSDEDYQRYYEAKLKVDFRNYMLKALELDEEEIEAVDPLMKSYMNERISLAEQKLELVEAYEEEMQEDDSRQDEVEETSDFIENYWEASIEEMQLKKRYFDLFEARMPYQKALEFFMLEDELQYQIARPTLLRVAPVLMKMKEVTQIDTQGMSYNYRLPEFAVVSPVEEEATTANPADKKKMQKKTWSENPKNQAKETNNWNRKEWKKKSTAMNSEMEMATAELYDWIDATEKKVDLDHAYTHDALYKLTTALRAMKKEGYFGSVDVEKRLTEIETMADKLQENWKSTMHADWARKAFITISDLLEIAQTDEQFTETKQAVAKTSSAARMIKEDRLMTDQAAHIYTFVDLAAEAIKTLEKEGRSSSNNETNTDDRDQ